ncbi:hypothetical protein R50072_38190 [Simiduia litorea]|uniref:PEP-CTERM sorting domain-containing protein n=1 Tax=Simiduia litorea TaxID=1435348 RepID=UPI0036F43575
MRHLLLILLLPYLALADVVGPEDDAVAAPIISQDPFGEFVDDSSANNGTSTKPLFWLPILTPNDFTAEAPHLNSPTHQPPPPSQYWQQPETQTRWPLPEPSTLLLFGAGILLVLVARHVRFANQRKKVRNQTKAD